jgi:hypothetical protein
MVLIDARVFIAALDLPIEGIGESSVIVRASKTIRRAGRRTTRYAIRLNPAIDYLILPRISSVWTAARAAPKKPSTMR